MREFRTQDGNIIHLPNDHQRPDMIESPWEPCDCHRRMGNDFYFLPAGVCLRVDKVCSHPTQPTISRE
jgi:hypothetical protein